MSCDVITEINTIAIRIFITEDCMREFVYSSSLRKEEKILYYLSKVLSASISKKEGPGRKAYGSFHSL